jgi:hypothetical protein
LIIVGYKRLYYLSHISSDLSNIVIVHPMQ